MPSEYALWQYLHILLFAYWLGADLGVYLAARYVARPELALAERLRFLELLLQIDMGPRTGLILMVPVGATLAAKSALAPVAAGWLPAIWVASLAWLALAWFLFLWPRHALAGPLALLDRGVRIAVVVLFVATGASTLLGAGPLAAGWLGAKFVLYGLVVVAGLLLRGTLRDWAAGFELLREPATVAAGNARITQAWLQARRYAHALWLAVALIALLGVTKPAV
ncbi:MAG: hypothetical protein U1F11_12920 [Steroidobacteraceae bacterium]